jgi:methionyl-tRNA formyltransferase
MSHHPNPHPLKIIFMGTPDFSVPALEALIAEGHHILAVYSQPPRPKGRGQQVQMSPVHQMAAYHDIPVFTPRSLKRDEQARKEFLMLNADVAVVAAYGLILPKDVLEWPRYGCLNIHASLLPRWRGASPIQHSIWKGDKESGICIMKMEEGLDTGPVLMRRSVDIRPQTTAQSLHDELSSLGAVMITETIRQIAHDHALPPLAAQDDSASTYAPLLKKEDGLIDWNMNAQEIDCQIRALNPWPGVYTFNDKGMRLKILGVALETGSAGVPGTIIDQKGLVACGQVTAIRLLKVQPDNAKPMEFSAALNGHYVGPGMVLGSSA